MADNTGYHMRTINSNGDVWINSKDLTIYLMGLEKTCNSFIPAENSVQAIKACSLILDVVLTEIKKWK